MSIAGLADDEGEGEEPLAADEAARIILDGIKDDDFRIIVGGDARLMDVLSRVAPRRATHFIQKRMASWLAHPQSGR